MIQKKLQIKNLNGHEFIVNHITHRQSTSIYTVEKMSGEWPTEKDLIKLCDPYNLGGHVDICNDKNAIVTVHTD